MTLMRYEPGYINRLHDEMNKIFDSWGTPFNPESSNVATSHWAPAVDIKEEEDKFVIHADIPGVDPNKIEVTMDKGVIAIKGTRETVNEEEKDNYKRVERSRGTFYRRFTLPDTADVEKITAKSNNGVLELLIPKQAQVASRRIKVEG